ncbi:MAG: ABC transporter ATP-binding protein [Desulfomonilaceae bacterium]
MEMERQYTSNRTLVELIGVSVRIGDTCILSEINWSLRSGENWAILGHNGAGKTTFLSVVRGDVWPAPEGGKRLYHLNGKPQEGPIGFHEKTGAVSSDLLDRYRINGWNLTGLEVVCTGFYRTAFLYDQPTDLMLKRAHGVLEMLDIEELSTRRIFSMSFGEAKKILIARALVHEPDILFIDELCAGLDRESKTKVLSLTQAIAENGTQIIFAAHGPEEVPPSITNLLTLESGRIVKIERLSETVSVTKTKNTIIPEATAHKAQITPCHSCDVTPLIEIENVNFSSGGDALLILKNINWTVRTGENWALLGQNGSGKTTLLKLIVGEERPVWGGNIRRFGNEKAQTIDEIRRVISLVTPDFQAEHMVNQTAMEMVISGFRGSVGVTHPPNSEEIAIAQSWFKNFGIGWIEKRQVRTLSYGQIRMLLIMRALVNDPKLLILDEPTTGLDSNAKKSVWEAVKEIVAKGTNLICVTHDFDEIWSFVTHVAIMSNGRLCFKGPKNRWSGTF